MSQSGSSRPAEAYPESGASPLFARALLGWMDQEQGIKFLMEDCLFSAPLTFGAAKEIWERHKAIVENLPRKEQFPPRKLPLSAADLKATRKFRAKHPNSDSVVDFVRLSPMDLVVHQLWVSTVISDGYRDRVTPDQWLRTALLDPPSNSQFKWRREDNTIVFDLPHSEFVLAGPSQPHGLLRISEVESFITVAFHADHALLMTGYHRTFACARAALEAVNAPHGVLFGVSNYLTLMGHEASDVLSLMEAPRPPRMGDFFDDRLFLPVTLRRRRYQMRVRCEVAEIDEEEAQPVGGQSPLNAMTVIGQTSQRGIETAQDLLPDNHKQRETPKGPDRGPNALRDVRGIVRDALRHQDAGRLHNAVALYKRALALKPDTAEIHNNLGVVLAAQGKIDDAVAHYKRAFVLMPDYAAAHNNLGRLLSTLGSHDDAIAHYERALAIDPDQAEAHNNLGNILKEQGRFDDAMEHYGRAIAIRPDYAEAHFNRTEIKTYHHGDADLAVLETLAGRHDLSANQTLHIHFAFAKALEDSGDYARAFEHLREGNALKRRQIDYDEARFVRSFQRISAVFDSSLFDRLHGEGNPSFVPIFVVGMPRTGSTLIEQILASHPQIQGAGEVGDLEPAARSVLNPGVQSVRFPEWVPKLDGFALRRMGEAYVARLPALANGKVRIVDKTPSNFFTLGLIRMVLPNARIIHTERNPIDTCVSCFSKLFTSGQAYSYDLAELGRFYSHYKELMTHWRSVLPPDAILDVCYEDVVDDLDGQARRMIEYCGLPWDDRCLNFHRTSRPVKTASSVQVRKPLFRSSLQRWRKYEAFLAPLLNELGAVISNHALVPNGRTMAAHNSGGGLPLDFHHSGAGGLPTQP